MTKVDDGIICSNGPCWSPDDKTFYFADTFQGEYWAYDYDIATGHAVEQARVRLLEGGRRRRRRLDGRRRGLLWNAQLISGDLVRYAPDGTRGAAHRHAGAQHHQRHVRRRPARRDLRHVDGAGEAPGGARRFAKEAKPQFLAGSLFR